jgi:hypothetical protein
VARVNATPRRLSRGKGGTGRGRLGVCHLHRGLAVLGTRSGAGGPSTLIEHLPSRGRNARQCEPSEVKVDNEDRPRGRFGGEVARTFGGDSLVLRTARRAGRIHVSSVRTRTTLRRSGGRLVDRPESLVVVVSTGRSRSSRGSLHASPGSTVEEQASQGRHPFAVSMGFRAQPLTSQRSPRCGINRHALPTTPVARARRALFGDIRMASGVQRGAEEWRRERRVREKGCPTP